MPDLEDLLERASAALVVMDYPRCEALCVEALAHARGVGDWETYARAVMPLQESRRQRRMRAGDSAVQLGTAGGFHGFGSDASSAGCVCFTYPHQPRDAWDYWSRCVGEHRSVQVMFADCASSAERWTLRSLRRPDVSVEVSAPPSAFVDRVVHPMALDPASGMTAVHWFIASHEALGDAALACVSAAVGTVARVSELEAWIEAVGDHELLHQALRDAALSLVRPVVRTVESKPTP